MPSFIVVGYVWEILGREDFLPLSSIHEQPRKDQSWIGLKVCLNKYKKSSEYFSATISKSFLASSDVSNLSWNFAKWSLVWSMSCFWSRMLPTSALWLLRISEVMQKALPFYLYTCIILKHKMTILWQYFYKELFCHVEVIVMKKTSECP